ncbi:MAG TPA: flagellar protein FlgN [Gammaproteobacteria bacterium]|nr:flagellar protein FlgN [Gammaproteobacteria bacterium]
MNDENFRQVAQALLEKQQSLSTQLLEQLKQEYKILSTQAADSLHNITLNKQTLVAELNELNQHWLALLSTYCNSINPNNIAAFLLKYDDTHATSLLERWEALQTTAGECQKANTINGKIITLRFQAAQQTIAILRGQMPGDTTYDPHGNNTTAYVASNALAKA